MPYYEMSLTAVCLVLVEAETPEEAEEIAINETSSGEYIFLEGTPAKQVIDWKQIDCLHRHADKIIEVD